MSIFERLNIILFGFVNTKDYYLILPISLLIIGLVIKYRAQRNDTYVGRLTMFSNSMALLSFYSSIPNLYSWVIYVVNFSVIIGLLGIISYSGLISRLRRLSGRYYWITSWFDFIYVGLLIILYYIRPSLFIIPL